MKPMTQDYLRIALGTLALLLGPDGFAQAQETVEVLTSDPLVVIAEAGTNDIQIQRDLEIATSDLISGRLYLVGFPQKGRNRVRQDYLGVDANGEILVDANGEPLARLPFLQRAIDLATSVRSHPGKRLVASAQDEDLAQLIAWESLEALLQGQLIAGNGNLLKGLRVAFPTAVGDGERPGGEDVLPVGCPGRDPGTEYSGCKITDLCYARLHFFRGIVSALDFMTSDTTGEIRVLDLLNDPFTQYTSFGTPQLPDPNFTNEFSQTTAYLLGNILDRYGKAVVGIGDRLWRAAYFDKRRSPSCDSSKENCRPTEREEMLEAAMTELQRGAHSQFLAALPLAATLPEDEMGYGKCRIDQVRVTVATAGTFIDRIRRGEIPKLDDLNLDSSTASIQQQVALVERLQQDVNDKYALAETAIWRRKDAEAQIIEDAKTLRFQFCDLLQSATGIPCGEENELPFFGLMTGQGRERYRQAVAVKANLMLKAELKSPLLTDGSELGQAMLQIQRARAEIASARNRIDAIPAQIQIEEQRVGKINGKIKDTAIEIGIYEAAIGLANSVSVSVSAGFPSGVSVSTTFNPGSIVAGILQSQITRARAIQEMEINKVNAEATVKNLLLQQHQFILDLQSAAAQGQLAGANLAALRDKIERLIENAAYFQNANGTKWYSDPGLIFEQENAEIDYENALREFVREAYILTQMLGVRWGEVFEHPYLKADATPTDLGGGQFDDFTQPESVFNIFEAREANNFFTALFEWDTKLRQQRHGGEVSRTSIISLRQDIFGLSDVIHNSSHQRFEINSDPAVLAWNRRRFHALLLRNMEMTSSRYWLRLDFPITYNQYSRTYTGFIANQPAVILAPRAAWNLRVKELSIKFIGENIAQSPDNTLLVQLSQYGKIEIVKYHPREPDIYPNFLTFNLPLYYPDPEGTSISPFTFFVNAGINGTPGVPNVEIADVEPTPYCDRYVLLIEVGANPPLNIHNIEDIILTLKWESGAPPTFFQ